MSHQAGRCIYNADLQLDWSMSTSTDRSNPARLNIGARLAVQVKNVACCMRASGEISRQASLGSVPMHVRPGRTFARGDGPHFGDDRIVTALLPGEDPQAAPVDPAARAARSIHTRQRRWPATDERPALLNAEGDDPVRACERARQKARRHFGLLARQSPQHHVESNLGVSFPVGIPTFPAVPLTILEQMSFGPEGSSPREFSAWLCTYRSACLAGSSPR